MQNPLIISGPTPTGDKHEFNELKHKIDTLVNAQKDTLLQFFPTQKAH